MSLYEVHNVSLYDALKGPSTYVTWSKRNGRKTVPQHYSIAQIGHCQLFNSYRDGGYHNTVVPKPSSCNSVMAKLKAGISMNGSHCKYLLKHNQNSTHQLGPKPLLKISKGKLLKNH